MQKKKEKYIRKDINKPKEMCLEYLWASLGHCRSRRP